MKIKIGNYELENDCEVKCIPDGYEIFSDTVELYGIDPNEFTDAQWAGESPNESIIIIKE